jgi:hypothetical protein
VADERYCFELPAASATSRPRRWATSLGAVWPGPARRSRPCRPPLSYDELWQERSIRSVANLTRRDAEEFLALAPQIPIATKVTTYALEATEQALADLRAGRFEGSAVIVP